MTSYSRTLDVDTWQGLDLRNIDRTTPEEIDAHLIESWSHRQPLYNLYANSLMIDYAPDFAKLHRWGSDFFGRHPANVLMLAAQNMQSYMMLGWETGILNTFHTLRRSGLTKGQVMEIVMFSQLYAGMRGLGHVYRAVGDILAVFADPVSAPTFPDGWGATRRRSSAAWTSRRGPSLTRTARTSPAGTRRRSATCRTRSSSASSIIRSSSR